MAPPQASTYASSVAAHPARRPVNWTLVILAAIFVSGLVATVYLLRPVPGGVSNPTMHQPADPASAKEQEKAIRGVATNYKTWLGQRYGQTADPKPLGIDDEVLPNLRNVDFAACPIEIQGAFADYENAWVDLADSEHRLFDYLAAHSDGGDTQQAFLKGLPASGDPKVAAMAKALVEARDEAKQDLETRTEALIRFTG